MFVNPSLNNTPLEVTLMKNYSYLEFSKIKKNILRVNLIDDYLSLPQSLMVLVLN